MSWLKVLEGLTELGLYLKRVVAKSEKDKYETERKATSSAPADAFQRDFDAGRLHDKSRVRPSKTDNGRGE